MYEHAAEFLGGPPNQAHFDLYSRWADGQWGMIVTGNVQVSKGHLTLGRDLVIPDEITYDALEPFRRLAAVMHDETGEKMHCGGQSVPLAIMQLNHAGRQSSRILGGRGLLGRPLAPSPIRLNATRSKTRHTRAIALTWIMDHILFSEPTQMSVDDIDNVIDSFTRGAQVAAKSGFDGIQLHAAHGCERHGNLIVSFTERHMVYQILLLNLYLRRFALVFDSVP